jgi:hypothetical protein
MNKLWHENSTNEKEDTSKCTTGQCKEQEQIEVSYSIYYVSIFTADRHQLEKIFLNQKVATSQQCIFKYIENI